MAVVFGGTRGMILVARRPRNRARWEKKVTTTMTTTRDGGGTLAGRGSGREKCAKVGEEVGVPSIAHVDNRAFETRASARAASCVCAAGEGQDDSPDARA